MNKLIWQLFEIVRDLVNKAPTAEDTKRLSEWASAFRIKAGDVDKEDNKEAAEEHPPFEPDQEAELEELEHEPAHAGHSAPRSKAKHKRR